MANGIALKGSELSGGRDLRVGFIVSNLYHLFQYRAIRKHLRCAVSAYIEVRKDNYGVTRKFVDEYLGVCDVKWVKSDDLGSIDGECDVLVCLTPVPLMKFFSRSLVVAQQYSLAKEEYQYGLWRAQASLNLMYGDYSAAKVSPYSNAVSVGNPLLDGWVSKGQLPALRVRGSGPLRVLYMPTYGDLSDKALVLDSLMEQQVDLVVKAHHADFQIRHLAGERGVPLFLSDLDPIDLILRSDVVVSDYSGAIYDALATRTPVVLVGSLNEESVDAARLSSEDRSRASVSELASIWSPTESLRAAYEQSAQALNDEKLYQGFISRFYVNVGCAGEVCAREIEALALNGERQDFAVQQVRQTTRRYILDNRKLRARVKALSKQKGNGRAGQRMGRKVVPRLTPAQAFVSMVKHDTFGVMILKSVRYVSLRVPGGPVLFDKLRGLRRRFRSGRQLMEAQTVDSPLIPLSSTKAIIKPTDLCEVPSLRRRQLLDLFQEALREADVDFRVCATNYWAYIAVREENVDSLYRAIGVMASKTGARIKFWVGAGAAYNTILYSDTIELGDLVACESFVAGIPYKNKSYSLERAGGVEFLLVAERDSRLVSRRGRSEKTDWTAEFLGVEKAESAVAAPCFLDTLREDKIVDVVYTWVDSNDPEWRASRVAWADASEIEMQSAGNDERYLDREELRYSLRSVWMYAPFVRNIYIVTSGHRPSWLVDDNDRVRIVSHREIFPDEGDLPTFNSHSIEACLHRIPGLAENFLYFNDDFFLGAEVRYDTFYTKYGHIKSRFSPSSFAAETEPAPDAIPTDWASYNAVKLMKDDYGIRFDRKLKHLPYAMKKSLVEEMESRYPELFRNSRSSRFRNKNDYAIPSMLAHYYGVATGRAIEWENVPREYAYADTGRADFSSRLEEIPKFSPTFICLNATMHDDIDFDAQSRLLQAFLKERYPVPSPFETNIPPAWRRGVAGIAKSVG